MDLREEGKKILRTHQILFEQLIQIPLQREILYREDIENENHIGKPRFIPEEYEWSSDLLKYLHNHLQSIYLFFEKYYYWYDDTLIPLIDKRFRRTSKNSIIFLLEKDVYATDEAYGDYLIEKNEDKTLVYYYRRDKKIRQFELSSIDSKEIMEWICNNAVGQIQEQLKFLWNRLRTEIKVCMEEKYHKKPETKLSIEYLEDQIQKVTGILDDWPEAALLSIGRIIEIWLKHELEYRTLEKYDDIIRLAEVDGIITKNNRKLLIKIRKNYNNLKHNLHYKLDKVFVSALITDFIRIFK